MYPPVANYNTPPSASYRSQKQRGYRLCDQCGAVENPAMGARFRLCGGCMTTQYCSVECQKVHWPSHKPICQHTTALLKTHSAPSMGSEENIAKNLRKFTSAHTSLLSWAGFQALRLRRVPANIRQKLFCVEVEPRGHVESHRRFTLVGTHVLPLSHIRDPLVMQDLQWREQRARSSGGLGLLVILIQCGGVSQVLPVEVDDLRKVSWDEREDWEEVVERFVESGRVDFMPISTTARGVRYG